MGVPRVHAYFDASGRIISFEYPDRHYATRELTYVSTHDTKRFHVEEECYLLSSEWHAKWIDFVTKQSTKPPSFITNAALVTSDFEKLKTAPSSSTARPRIVETSLGGFEQVMDSPNEQGTSNTVRKRGPHLRPDAKPKQHFRPVNKLVWEYLFKLYGGGPVITFKVPPGLDPDYYIDGSWVKRLNLSDIAIVIFPSEDPEPPRIQHVDNPIAGANAMIGNNVTLAGNMMLNDLSRSKFRQANAMQSQIEQDRANAIAANLGVDIAKKKMEVAKQKQLEANMQFAGSVATLFKGSGTKKKASDDAAKLAKKKAIQTEISVLMARNNLKVQFHNAVQSKNVKDAKRLAAFIIRNIWQVKKSKLAARRLHRDNMARKIQSTYRIHLAHKKMKKLADERRNLKENASAFMIQALWRRRKLELKFKAIKAKKQHLLEEGAVLRIQSRWRIVQSRRALIHLRNKNIEKIQYLRAKADKIIFKFLRVAAARSHLRKIIQRRRNLLIVHVRQATGLLNRCTHVAVNVHIEKGTILDPTIEIPTNRNNRVTLSLYKTQCSMDPSHPQWEEDCLVVNASIQDKLVLTVVNQNVSGKKDQPDEFLGQASNQPSHLL